MPTATPAKWHGGKAYLSGKLWDIALSTGWRPIHVVEPYCGGASFTLEGLARDLPFSFVVNDISRELTNFWRVLRSDVQFPKFCRAAQSVPFSEVEWNEAGNHSLVLADDPEGDWRAALRFFVRNRQSLAGRMKGFTGITRTRTRRKMNNEVSAWLTAVDSLPDFHAMLRKVLILDARPAPGVIRSQDGPSTLIYADPPYAHDTRVTTTEYGEHEMSLADHEALLAVIRGCVGKVMLSGYRNGLYDGRLGDWNRHDFEISNHASGKKKKERKTESVWCNF